MYNFKDGFKSFLKLGFVLIMIVSIISTPIYAADSDDVNYDYALKLKELGVFVGTGSGFELSRVPSRVEGIVMLVRLIGKENEALTMAANSTNFTDVPPWAKGYVNYAQSMGLTNGISPTKFGSNDPMSANMYVTFLLRSLGYSDAKGDFDWEDSLSKAKSIGMITSTSPYTSTTFIRSHVAKLSYDALLTLYKNSPTTLAQYLVNLGVLDEKTAVAIQVIDNPAIFNGNFYALKDPSFYDIGENDCYVDVVASASISNVKKSDVYFHKEDTDKVNHSLLNIPVSGYSRLVFRIVEENASPSNRVHILNGRIDKLSQAQSAKPYASYSISETSQLISLDLTSYKDSETSIYIETQGQGTIFIYNLYLD